jgi:hypothetical protein
MTRHSPRSTPWLATLSVQDLRVLLLRARVRSSKSDKARSEQASSNSVVQKLRFVA